MSLSNDVGDWNKTKLWRFTALWLKSSLVFYYLKHIVMVVKNVWERSVSGNVDEGETNIGHEGDEETETKELRRNVNLFDLSITFCGCIFG